MAGMLRIANGCARGGTRSLWLADLGGGTRFNRRNDPRLRLQSRRHSEEVKALTATFASAKTSVALGDRPLVVLTSAQPKSAQQLRELALTEQQGERLLAAWLLLQKDEAAWSTNSRHELLTDASHAIQFDRPDAVIRAVRHVVGAVRQSAVEPAARGAAAR